MTLLLGDCIEAMRGLAEASVDAVVTDPPYGLGFMGKEWDSAFTPADVPMRRSAALDAVNAGAARQGGRQRAGVDFQRRMARDSRAFQSWCEAWATEALRVLKPGGHALVFGGTRTYHRLACGLEDAGFEIRDCLVWLYGSGFPKSLDVSKAIDKATGAEGSWRREDHPGRSGPRRHEGGMIGQGKHSNDENPDGLRHVYESSSPEAERWQGWGTALKPAHEPIVVARKPLAGTVAANVLEHGTGAINVDGCRVDVDDREVYERNHSGDRGHDGTRSIDNGTSTDLRPGGGSASEGRWPANVVLDEEAAALLDEQSGDLTSGANPTRRGSGKFLTAYGDFEGQRECVAHRGLDVGGASRFFYCAKTSRAERNAGLDGFETRDPNWSSGEQNPGSFQAEGTDRSARNHHPTVKPISLMRWLVRLVTPPGGTVLDPFLGSGTAGIAAALEGFEFTGIEREADYLAIAEARIVFWREHGEEGLRIVRERDAAEAQRRTRSDAGQLDLLAEEAS